VSGGQNRELRRTVRLRSARLSVWTQPVLKLRAKPKAPTYMGSQNREVTPLADVESIRLFEDET
jgi:hypothetical protein